MLFPALGAIFLDLKPYPFKALTDKSLSDLEQQVGLGAEMFVTLALWPARKTPCLGQGGMSSALC